MTVTRDTHQQGWALSPAIRVERQAIEPVAEREQTRRSKSIDADHVLRHTHRTVGDRLGLALASGDILACLIPAALINVGTQSTLGTTLVMVGLMAMGGLNRSRLSLSVLDDLPQIIRLWLVGAGFLIVVSELVTGNMQLTLFLGVLPAIVAIRTVLYGLIRNWRARGWVTHPTIVVGAGSFGQAVVDTLSRHPESGLRAIGFIDSRPLDAEALPIPVLGEASELTAVLKTTQARALIVAHGEMNDGDLVSMVRKSQRQQCEVFVLPRLPEITNVGSDMDSVGDTPLIRLRRSAYRSPSWRVKRLLDVAASAGAVVVLSPLLALIAVLVRWETGPGVIFRQERVGRDGIFFELMKFRSLKPVDETESQTNWNISHDNRVGPVGRILRKTSLDELPQLFNILRGDMSLVGPRPERPHFVEQFGELYIGYADRHRVPCGLTGWAQIHGLRGNTPIDLRVRFDNFYIENWTLWLDIKILLRTVVSVFTKPGS